MRSRRARSGSCASVITSYSIHYTKLYEFARSLGEFGATILVAGNIPGVTRTIPLAIYDYTNTPGGDRLALGLCLVAIVLSLVVLLFNEGLLKRFGWRREP